MIPAIVAGNSLATLPNLLCGWKVVGELSTPVFLARQPIYDNRLNVYGYELLYRRGPALGPGEMSEADSARSLTNALIEIGLNELVSRHKAFVNVSEGLITSGVLESFPRTRVILEVLEDVRPTEAVLTELKRLRKMGYTIALDDFIWNELTEPMLPLADLIKIDISQYHMTALPETLRKLRERPLRILAERVETHEEYAECRAMGFEYFQGYFMAKPEVVEGRSLPMNHLALVRLISKVNDPNLTLEDLEGIIASEVQLNVRLLKFIKGAYYDLPSKVDSIRKALLFVGIKTLAALASLLMLSQFSHKPSELVFTAMMRAKMCEQMARAKGFADTDRHFTVGMLSVLDALLDVPMKELLAQLPLSEEVNVALLDAECDSELAVVLQATLAYERGNFEAVTSAGFALSDANAAYRSSVAWAGHTQMTLAA